MGGGVAGFAPIVGILRPHCPKKVTLGVVGSPAPFLPIYQRAYGSAVWYHKDIAPFIRMLTLLYGTQGDVVGLRPVLLELYRVGVQDCYRRRYTAVPIVVTLLLEQCGYSDSSQNVWNGQRRGQKRGQKPRIPRITPLFQGFRTCLKVLGILP